MKITITTKPLPADLTILPLFAGQTSPEVREVGPDFKGDFAETYLLRRTLLLGLGKKSEYSLERLRQAMSAAAPIMQKLRVSRPGIATNAILSPKTAAAAAAALVEGILLSNYRFLDYKNFTPEERPANLEELAIVIPDSRLKPRVVKGARQGEVLSSAVNFARNLGNHPGNVATPSHLAKHAHELGRNFQSIKVRVLERSDMAREKMGALLAVAQGSEEPPKFIILEYRGRKSASPIVLVGKGITFDSGGISLKPGEKMEEMKYDMAGAATVMGIIRAAATLNLPLHLIGLVPATENLPSGKALKPGDIVRSRSGKTIEVINTDAEGRLVLCDALDYAKQFKPALVIDFATLTGSIVAALGDDVAGAFTNKEMLLPELRAAAKITGEKIWPMPLEPGYEEFLKSDFADLRNISTMKFGDAINAANFLKQFTDYPWIHLDIAGVAWATREKPYRPKGATGFAVRLIVEFLKTFKK